LDVYTRLKDGDIRRDAQKIEQVFDKAGDRAGRAFGENLSAGIERSAPKVERNAARMEKATSKVADAISRTRVEQAKYDEVAKKSDATDRQKIERSEALAKAKRAEASAIREASRVHQDSSREILNISRAGSEATGTLAQMGTVVGSLGRVAGPAGIGVLAGSIGALAGVAAAASGVIGALPGVIGGAAAAFGTLKIATLGFGEAMENLRDTEKFNEAIRQLSPNAREAALSIRSLMPAFDNLKNATQDALFANVGPQIEALSAQFLPALQRMTTGISSAFNSMFMGITNQLMTPEMTKVIENITGNITAAFQNLAPAATSMTNAFAQLTSVGSNFLPGLATAAASAAESFSKFITEAANSGQLQQWIQTGMDMMKQLGAATLNVLEAFVAMAPVGERIMPAIVNATEVLVDLMPVLNSLIVPISPLLTGWAPAIEGASGAVSGLMAVMSPLLATVTAIADAWAYIRGESRTGGGGGRTLRAPGGGAGVPGSLPGGIGGIGGGAGMPQGVGGTGGRGIGEISPWSGNPINNGRGGAGAGAGGLPEAPVLPLGPMANPNQSATLFSAEQSVLDARHSVEEKRARLNQLEGSAAASANDIQDARNDVLRAEQSELEAQMRLNEARKTAAERGMKQLDGLSSDLGQIGAQLDADFGISKGLGGIAENITKFVANLAAAPLLGQLGAISAANPSKGGHGIMGMLAAQGAFGPNHTGIQQQSYAYQASAMGPMPVGASGGAYPGDAALLSNVPVGRYTQSERGDLTQGLADCSSAIEDLVNLMDGRPTSGASMYTGNAAEFLQSRGFQPGMGGLGDMRVGYNSGHMQATLPGGTPFNWGSNASAANRGIGGTGADDPSFTDHWYRPAAFTGAENTGAVGPPTPYNANYPTGGGNFNPNMQIDTSRASVAPPFNPNAITPWSLGQNTVGDNGLAPGEGVPGQGGPLAAMAPTRIGGVEPNRGTGGGGIGMASGGLLDMGMQAGGMALDVMAPGAGQAAQMGMKLANRAIEFGGQAAGIGAQGLIDTFLPIGGSQLASNNWLTKIAGGLAGAGAAIPNVAGQSSQPTPEQLAGQPSAPQQSGVGGQAAQISHQTTINAGKDRSGAGIARDFEYHTSAASRGPGM
jgi:hypothetical protein